jgi:hypothetical protein
MRPRHFNLCGFRTWFTLTKIIWPLMIVGILCHALGLAYPDFGGAVVLTGFFAASVMLFTALGILGAVMCILMFLGEVRMRCPFCGAFGTVGGDKENGVWMTCHTCGYIHGSGRLGWSLVTEPTAASLTHTWKKDPSVPLIVDFDTHQLSGVGIGDAIQKLAFLGPARNDDAAGSWYVFRESGIAVGADEGITYFCVHLLPDPDEGIEAFPGALRYHGELLSRRNLAFEVDVRRTFGEPYWRKQDEDEILLFYEFGAVEWQIELTLEQKTKVVAISIPVLDDPEERKEYGVTREWPPNEEPLKSQGATGESRGGALS